MVPRADRRGGNRGKCDMRGSAGWVAGGVALVLAGVVVGFLITANYDLAPVSNAQEESGVATAFAPSAAAIGESPFVAVADEVLPAVVSVDTRRTVRRAQGRDPFRDMLRDFFGDQMFPYEDSPDRQYREYEVPSSASGFIFDERGYIMTNNHVVNGADEIEVTLTDGREFSAEVVGQDPSTDIAVIRIDGDDLPSVRVGDSDGIRVGQWAIAIGNPLELSGTVTVGVVSAVGRADLQIRGGGPIYQDFIQTDASINFGNSGGPLVNIRGEVIGVNAAVNAAAQGIGFAIPINLAWEVADALVSDGKVVRGYLGVVPQDITSELAEAKDLDGLEGVLIASVERGTPADKAGLEPGDVVLKFAGVEIQNTPHFRRVVAGVAPNERVDVVIVRDGERRTLKAELEERPDDYAEAEAEPVEDVTWLGINVVGLDDSIVDEFDLQATSGVLIVDVEPGSPAADGGLEVGDVIVRIGDRDVTGLRDYRSIMEDLEGRTKAIAFMVQRGEHTYFVAVKPE